MEMSLDEAIKHAEEVVEEQEKAAKEWHENQVRKCELIPFSEMDYTHENECKKCVEEHRQLAEWLKDYKRLLDQQPCEDAISREHTLTEFKRLYFDNDTVIRCAELVLGGEPSVYPKPRTGHWISQVDLDDTHYGYICDKCNKWVRDKSYYCPNCGAKMVEPQESEDKDGKGKER